MGTDEAAATRRKRRIVAIAVGLILVFGIVVVSVALKYVYRDFMRSQTVAVGQEARAKIENLASGLTIPANATDFYYCAASYGSDYDINAAFTADLEDCWRAAEDFSGSSRAAFEVWEPKSFISEKDALGLPLERDKVHAPRLWGVPRITSGRWKHVTEALDDPANDDPICAVRHALVDTQNSRVYLIYLDF